MNGSAKAVNRIGGIAGQGFNSLGNLAFAATVAQVTVPAEYGAWAIAYAVYVGATAISRAVAGTPLLIRESSDDAAAVSLGVYLAVAIGGIGSLVLLPLGLLAPAFAPAALSLCAFMPAVLWQDVLRYQLMAQRRSHLAAAGDLVWLVVQLGVTAVLFAGGRASTVTLGVAWGMGGLVGALVLFALVGVRPSLRLFRREVVRGRASLLRLGAEASLLNARVYLIVVGVGVVAGLHAAGSLRAGFTLLGVFSVVILGITPLATVDAARHRDVGRSDWSFLAAWSALVFGIAFVLGAALLLLPDAWGVGLLGANWHGAEPVLLALVVDSLLRGPMTAVPILMRVHGQFAAALRLRIWAEGPALAIPLAGAALWGAPGAAWGLVANAVQMNVQSVVHLSRAIRLRRAQGGAERVPAAIDGGR